MIHASLQPKGNSLKAKEVGLQEWPTEAGYVQTSLFPAIEGTRKITYIGNTYMSCGPQKQLREQVLTVIQAIASLANQEGGQCIVAGNLNCTMSGIPRPEHIMIRPYYAQDRRFKKYLETPIGDSTWEYFPAINTWSYRKETPTATLSKDD